MRGLDEKHNIWLYVQILLVLEMINPLVFALVTFLHELFTVVWIGGLVTLGITIAPVSRQVFGQEAVKLMDAVQRRLNKLIYVCIIGLFATGVLLASRSGVFTGLISFGNTYSTLITIKHMVYVVMVIIAVLRSRFIKSEKSPEAQKRSMLLLMGNMALGLLTLLLTALASAYR